MSEKVTGLVVELNRRTCVLLTPEGEFVEAAKPSGQNLKVGEVATLNRHKPFHLYRSLALAACLMITLMGWTAYSTYLPTAVAYISLDINPSLELAVGRQGQVVGATSFNPEAESLLQQVEVKGKPVAEAIENLIDTAVQLQFIDQSNANQILVTVELEPKAPPEVVDQAAVEETIVKTIAKNNVDAKLAVAPIAPDLHKQAQQQRVSAGRYLLYQQSQSQGKPVEVKDFAQKHLDELGYQNWPKENVRELKNKSGSSKDDTDRKEADNSQKEDRSDNRRVESQEQKTHDQQESRENRDKKDDRDKKIKDSRSQGFNSSGRSPWNLFNNRYNLGQKFGTYENQLLKNGKKFKED